MQGVKSLLGSCDYSGRFHFIDIARRKEKKWDAGKNVSVGESAKIETVNYLLICQRPHVHASSRKNSSDRWVDGDS